MFARHPEQWRRLREEPGLVSRAINEAIRLESPVQGFGRRATRDVEIDGYLIPEGAIVLMLFAAANRDERKYPDPDRFDVGRDCGGHLGFGHAAHLCVGMNLAKLELNALVYALLPRVERFELLGEQRAANNMLRGFDSLPVAVS
ncbi:MAG TPA: cytochrome P450 [Caulobacteraceae bacterium]|nr:cytochrome P450 [Caulobacteraceae bacterium]